MQLRMVLVLHWTMTHYDDAWWVKCSCESSLSLRWTVTRYAPLGSAMSLVMVDGCPIPAADRRHEQPCIEAMVLPIGLLLATALWCPISVKGQRIGLIDMVITKEASMIWCCDSYFFCARILYYQATINRGLRSISFPFVTQMYGRDIETIAVYSEIEYF